MRGKLITLEGIDGAGKSTHLTWLADWLRRRGIAVRVTREPGGTELGEKLRQILLDRNQSMHHETEALLMFAARREHIDKVIEPVLERGEWVVCDRFTDATFAYQGSGRGVDWVKLRILEHWVHGTLQPDLSILLDLPLEVAKQRLAGNRNADRFEREQSDFFQHVRDGYLKRAKETPARIHVVDASQSVEQIRQKLAEIAGALCR